MENAAGNNWTDEDWEDMPQPVICRPKYLCTLHKVNHKMCSTLTSAITIWPMVTFRYTRITIMPSTTMPGLL
jgi:hypothetical protein